MSAGVDQMKDLPFHVLDAAAAARTLQTDPTAGLTQEEAERRLRAVGPNRLPDREGRPASAIVVDQLRSTMVVMLLVAAVVSAYLGGLTDAIAIIAIVLLNAVLGFLQDHRAEQAMAALRKLSIPQVEVRRVSGAQTIRASDIAPGDLLLLQAGDQVAADGRLMRVEGLMTSEAALTGESTPVDKHVQSLSDVAAPVADRANMCFRGTAVIRGRGAMLVTATGLRTEIGRIAEMLQTVARRPTPLQRRLAHFGRLLAGLALLLVGTVVVLGLLRGEAFETLLMTGLSLAVAAVPEGLPTVATVALALGARRMLKRNALVRKLPAVEAMGAVTVICTDKTGTLTQNRMTVTEYALPGRDSQTVGPVSAASARGLLTCAALCNDANIDMKHEPTGDPTELAFLRGALEAGMAPADLRRSFPRHRTVPFDSQRMRMTTVHLPAIGATWELPTVFGAALPSTAPFGCIKGSAAGVLDVCDRVCTARGVEVLDAELRSRLETQEAALAGRGLRVLGVAVRPFDDLPDASALDTSLESRAVFLGLLALQDPLRPEAALAMDECRAAGIKPVMITGDHPRTAHTIGTSLGIAGEGSTCTGAELEGLDGADAFADVVARTTIYARVSPEHKLRIVASLQASGEIVAMTGDGINDAPALKQADIGVAMGKIGTEVAREAADVVLLDDNFATIVHAVEDGRAIFQNVYKFLRYTMTSNAGEIATMLLGPLSAVSLPLLPLQILWINLVTDGVPGLALAVEPTEQGTMSQPPREPEAALFNRALAFDVCWVGALMGGISLGVASLLAPDDEPRFRTVVFTVLTLSQLGNALAVRSQTRSFWSLSSNPVMAWAVAGSVLAQMAVLYLPPLQAILHTTALPPIDIVICLLSSTVVLSAIEARKWVLRRRSPA